MKSSAAYLKVSGERVDLASVTAVMYFDAVAIKDLPRAEAAFYQRKSNLYVGYGDYSADYLDANTQLIGANYYIPDTIVVAGRVLSRVSSEWHEYEEFSGSSDSWRAYLGGAPFDGLVVTTEFEDDVDYADTPNIYAKYIKPLTNGDALSVSAGVARTGHDRYLSQYRYSTAVDYYLTQDFSLGLSMVAETGGELDYRDYSVMAAYFFTEYFSLAGTCDYSDDGDWYHLSARLRF